MDKRFSSTTLFLAKVCECCPVCRTARKKQAGFCYQMVKNVERKTCPFCRAYARVHGRLPHEPEVRQ